MAVLDAGVSDVLKKIPESGRACCGHRARLQSCTVLPVTDQGVPLCRLPAWSNRPHAWPKLWKHHSAQHVADRLNEVAAALLRSRSWPATGAVSSSEWYFPKLIEIWLEDRDVYDASGAFLEATDWVVFGSSVGTSAGRPARPLIKPCGRSRKGCPALPFSRLPTPGSHVLLTSWATPSTPSVAGPGTCGVIWRASGVWRAQLPWP